MGYAILRIAKRKTIASCGAMLTHALRETSVPNAVEGAPKPVPISGARSAAEGIDLLRAGIALAKEKGGPQGFTKASTPVLDVLVTSSNEHMQKMSLSDQNSYFKKALKFIAEKFGGMENILTAVIHRDETTPHMQVLLMPLDRTTSRFSAAKMIGGPPGMAEMQDQFWEACGKPHGMLRGEKKSRAEHVPVRRLYSAMNQGAEPPKFVEVPPAPGMLDRLKPGFSEKQQAHEAALEANRLVRKKLNEQAKSGRMMHPKMIEVQSNRYRKIVAMDSEVKAEKAAAAAARIEAANDKKAVSESVQELQRQAKAADSIWTKSGASMLDKMSKHLESDLVFKVARELKIELVPGKGLIDQMRRQGAGRTLIESASLLDKTIDSVKSRGLARPGSERPQERPKG